MGPADRPVASLVSGLSVVHTVILSTCVRCLFEVFTAIVSKANMQMCFSPGDERAFFQALRAGTWSCQQPLGYNHCVISRPGTFDAKAVCSRVDAMKAMASVKADKAMITKRIQVRSSLFSSVLVGYAHNSSFLSPCRKKSG